MTSKATLWADGRDPFGAKALQWAVDEGRKEIEKQHSAKREKRRGH